MVTLVALVGSACGGDDAAGPPEIEYGRDVCAECHMIITEARFAAAYRDPDGQPFVFDDIGEMLTHARSGESIDGVTAWVHDFETEEWLDAPDAWYVKSDFETPMAYGIVAFEEQETAGEFAREQEGTVLDWQDIVETVGSDSVQEPSRDG